MNIIEQTDSYKMKYPKEKLDIGQKLAITLIAFWTIIYGILLFHDHRPIIFIMFAFYSIMTIIISRFIYKKYNKKFSLTILMDIDGTLSRRSHK